MILAGARHFNYHPLKSTSALLDVIKKLPESQFDRVLGQLIAFRSRKNARQPSNRERVLLAGITRGAPPALVCEQRSLIEKRRIGRLTAVEQQRLMKVSDELEAFNVRWMRWLNELATLRGTTLRQLMSGLELPPRNSLRS